MRFHTDFSNSRIENFQRSIKGPTTSSAEYQKRRFLCIVGLGSPPCLPISARNVRRLGGPRRYEICQGPCSHSIRRQHEKKEIEISGVGEGQTNFSLARPAYTRDGLKALIKRFFAGCLLGKKPGLAIRHKKRVKSEFAIE